MKKILTIILTILVLACQRTSDTAQPADKWNGYGSLKSGEIIKTLWAGQNIDVGTVTYGIDDNANFYVTYQTNGNWLISEAHMFAGDKADMPVNKPGKPKIGKFPNSGTYDPWVSTVTFTVPLSELPPAEDPGFVVASHAVVHNTSNNQEETAWGDGEFKFSDKGWGWYATYYYNQEDNPFVVLYGTEYRNDSLMVYLINLTTGGSDLILSEYIGTTNTGAYDAAAYDAVSGNLFFATYPEGELWINPLDGTSSSFLSGTLLGEPASATFYDGNYYYVDAVTNEIKMVSFDENWNISSETTVSTIPESVTVSDIAISPDGSYMYMVGTMSDGSIELIEYDMVSDAYSSLSITLDSATQIAYGSDGVLYGIVDSANGGEMAYTIDPATGSATAIDSDDIAIVDIGDIAKGPVQ
ncbi:MAG: hypothetical protein GXO86_05440 [Chlorobi bacterium]|nr:hypothetical protein [Chlorobiota bacterium]